MSIQAKIVTFLMTDPSILKINFALKASTGSIPPRTAGTCSCYRQLDCWS